MSHSVRLRFVDGLERIRDHIAQQLVKLLRGPKVHPQAAGDLNRLIVSRVPYNAAEGQRDDTQVVASFQEKLNKMHGAPIIYDVNSLVSERQLFPAPNHDLIAHQKLPIGTVFDVSKLNAKAAGVESHGADAS